MDTLTSKWKRAIFIPKLLMGYLLSWLIKPFLSKNIVMVGGHVGELFDDNAKLMYQYLVKEQTKYSIYWCYSTHRNYRLTDLDGNKFVKLGSVFNYIIYFNALFVFYSHSNSSDIAPLANHLKVGHPIRVALGHGPDGLKKRSEDPLEDAELFTCLSHFERQIKNKYWHISNNKLAVTGLARYDGYSKKDFNKGIVKKILYLPTWRDWEYNENTGSFKKTESFKRIMSLFKNQQLKKTLADHDAELLVCLHPFFLKFRTDFDGVSQNNIHLTFDRISQLIKSCDCLITDYSSVAFDFFYLKKPIIFYQYDQKMFLNKRGAYLNFDHDLFGKVCHSEGELVTDISRIFDQVGKFDQFNQLRIKHFTYEDQNNCKRIFNVAKNWH